MGVNVYTFDIAAEMEEDGYAGSFIEFFWLDVNSISICIDKRYCL